MTASSAGGRGTAEHRPRVVATVGAFDGIHRGHQALLGQVVARARQLGVESSCVTFDPHPDEVLYPERRLTYLTDPAEKESILRDLGLDHIVVFEFTPRFATLSPGEFLALVQDRHRLAELWVGGDFAIGRQRSGTIAAVSDIGCVDGFAVHVVPPRTIDGEVVSSTLIRTLLGEGNLRRANHLLGRRYRIAGSVQHGDARGRQLGWPTANIRPDPQRTLPADGVYAAIIPLDGRDRRAVVNLGSRPTFQADERLLEAHLLDFDGDLYGAHLAVEFVDRVRDVRRFDSVDELRDQIARDAAAARLAEL